MSMIHASDSVYSADDLEAVQMLLGEAQQSRRTGDNHDADDCIEAVLLRLARGAGQRP